MKEFKLNGQTLRLYLEKAVYWVEEKTLILTDLHLGKITHFRKAGYAVPSVARHKNWVRLTRIIEMTTPETLLLLGDLFHSDWNHECTEFLQILEKTPAMQIELVLGNHDIIDRDFYLGSGIQVTEQKSKGPFLFTHQRLTKDQGELYNISGHVHPAVRLKGSARQSLVLSCFYFGQEYGILPAFGNFTGTSIIDFTKNDKVFVIARKEIIELV